MPNSWPTNPSACWRRLRFPCGDVPTPASIKNVAPGIYWLRMPLPFALDHINLWMVDDGDGFTLVDTGYGVPRLGSSGSGTSRGRFQAREEHRGHAPPSRPRRQRRLAVDAPARRCG